MTSVENASIIQIGSEDEALARSIPVYLLHLPLLPWQVVRDKVEQNSDGQACRRVSYVLVV